MTEFLHLLGDPAHWAFEAVSDAVYTIIGAVFMRWWVKNHDRKHHS